MYKDRPLSLYLDDLASAKPAPGGGSAAALEASAGCSLISMVLNFTLSNKRYLEYRQEASKDLRESERLRKDLTALIDEDVEAYGRLSSAFKAKQNNASAPEDLYRTACDTPLKVCAAAHESMNLLKKVARYGNRNLITDAAMAALMLYSAFLGARFNVYVNLKFISDNGYIDGVHRKLSETEVTMSQMKEDILHISEDIILK